MDQQSQQPMLTGTSPQSLDMETGKQRKSTLNKVICFFLVLFILLTMALLALLLLTLLAVGSGEDNICTSRECIRTASSFLDSMDPEVDPCQDFNRFVCGRWGERHIMPETVNKNSWFQEGKSLFEKRIIDFLQKEDSSSEPKAVHKARSLFRSCNDLDSMSSVGIGSLRDVLTRDIGITFIPPIEDKPSQSWIRTVAMTKKMLDLDVFLGFGIGQLPANRSVLKMIVNSPTKEHIYALLRKEARSDPENTLNELQRLLRPEILKFLRYFPEVDGVELPDLEQRLNRAANDIIFVMEALAQIELNEHVIRRTQNIVFEEQRISDLQDHVDSFASGRKSKIKFKQFFRTFLEGFPDLKLDLSDKGTVLVVNEPYIEELSQVLDSLTEQQIELYVWFEIVTSLAPHTNLELATLKRHIDEAGRPSGMTELRETLCLRTTAALMKPAVSYFMFEDPKLEENKEKVQQMLNTLKSSFSELLRRITWMDEQTKAKAEEKLREMKTHVAYVEVLKDAKKLDNDYRYLQVVESNYLDNVRNILKHSVHEAILTLKNPFEEDMLDYQMLDINAFYIANANNMFVSAGILQFPMYDLGLNVLNYGAIGVILGHELTHGFDDTGKKYDKDGNLYDWWSDDSDNEYDDRTQCYLHTYSNYTVEEVGKKVDGRLTLGENIADDGGLRGAFHAYTTMAKESDEEKKLPGLEKFTLEQLFFMSFAHAWCSDYRDTETLENDLKDLHSPDPARAVLALRNFEEFARVWNCPPGSRMNPEHERCKMWAD